MALIKCPECGHGVSDKAKSCPNCGYFFENMKFCKFCGERIPENSIVCTKCGKQVENLNQGQNGGITINNVANASSSHPQTEWVQSPHTSQVTQKEINKNTALILCILFGYFGVHKFYEGKSGMGVLYLFTLGFFGLGWIADIVIIAGKPNPYYV